MENQPGSFKSINSMGINLLRDLLKTTVDAGMKEKIEKRIKYLQDKYKNKKPKLPTGAGSSQSTSSMDSVDRTLANEIKVIPFEEPLPLPRQNSYVDLKDVPDPISKYIGSSKQAALSKRQEVADRIRNVTQHIQSKNNLRELLETIDKNNFEIAEFNIKLIKKI